MGVANVVVSLGKKGALLVDPQEALLVQSPKIEEKNPIGAGDSMVGGLTWGLSEGLSLAESLRWGIACGAAAASLSGTEIGSRALVEKLYSEI